MSSDRVDLTALEADDALIARVTAAPEPGQLNTELERLLANWRAVCQLTVCQLTVCQPTVCQPTVRQPTVRDRQHMSGDTSGC